MTNNPGTYAEVDCDVIHVTERAVLIDMDGERSEQTMKWVPKSLLDKDEGAVEVGNAQAIFVARWFAEKEGLI